MFYSNLYSAKYNTCQNCGKIFSTNGVLKKNQLDKRTFLCEHCGQIFNYKYNFDTHQKIMHSGDRHESL